jgi:hypothetical protein
MSKFTFYFKKIALAVLVFAIGLAAIPAVGASAAGLPTQSTPPPANQPGTSGLEQAWARVQASYLRESARLGKANEFIGKVQSLIDKANLKGWDTSAVQAALDALTAVIPAAQTAHDPGAAIISSHNGFDASGKVTDGAPAIETVKALAQVLKDTRTAMNGSGKALHEVVKAFRDAHHPGQGNPSTTP